MLLFFKRLLVDFTQFFVFYFNRFIILKKSKTHFMKFKKHFSFVLVSMLCSSIGIAQQKYPEDNASANKKMSSSALESIQKNKVEGSDGNVRVSDELMEMYKQKKIPSTQKNKNNGVDPFSNIITKGSKVRVQIIASSINDVPELIKTLTSKGLTDISAYENFINAYIEVSKIMLLEDITSIMMVTPEHKPILRSSKSLKQYFGQNSCFAF